MKRAFILVGSAIVLSVLFTSCQRESQVSTLFSDIPPEKSNVYFNNQVSDTEEFNSLLHANYYGGGGVAVGDINGDDLLDIYFTGNMVPDKLYLNKGGMKFEDISEKAGIIDDQGWSSSVLTGDINGDGFLDIYVTRELYGNRPDLLRNKLYLNNKDNTFTESAQEWGIAGTERSRGGTFFDYDNDGDLDLYLLNTPPNPGPLVAIDNNTLLLDQYTSLLYENKGTHFVDITKQAGLVNPGFPNSVVAADLNSDGWSDLYVTHDFSEGDCIYINQGDGTFSNMVDEMTGHISFGSMGVDAADINNDGLLDIFVSDMSAEDNYRMKANMGGMNPEAFWEVVNQGHHYQYMFNTLQLNTGNKTFSDVAQLAGLATTDWSWSSIIADFDNDGFKDVFVANGVLKDIRNTDALNKLSELHSNQTIRLASNYLEYADPSKFDKQGLERMLELFPSEKLLNYIYKNNGDYTFSKKMEDWGLAKKTFSNGTAYGDLDNDGDLDLIVNNINDYAQILENHASDNGTNYLRVKLSNSHSNHTVMGTKLWLHSNEGVQFFEITGTRGMYSSSEQLAHFGLGENARVDGLRIRWPDGKEQTIENPRINRTLDIDYSKSKNDYKPKIEPTNSIYGNITESLDLKVAHVENDFDDYQLQTLLPHKMSTYGPGLATGDVNGDGKEDFYLGGAAGFPGQLILQYDGAEFVRAEDQIFAADKSAEDTGALFFDFDGDGDQDLYVVSGGNEYPVDSEHYRDRLYLNDGSGNFTKATDALPDLRISGSKVYANDFDNDKDLDLFVAGHHIPGSYPEPASSALLMNQAGRFVDVTAEKAPGLIGVGMVNDAAWIDIDNDNNQDLLLAGEWMPITVFRNNMGVFENITEKSGLKETSGWWFSVATADIDGDGDQDLVAGNLGLNYKYKASPDEPFTVYYHDFDLNGSKDIVLAYYNFGGLYPLRGRSCSSEQIPQLSGKFDTYDLFAQSDVEIVYGAQNLEEAMRYESTTFASTYFENDGNGHFKWRRLPVEAQFSSVNDILIRDINRDENLDIIIAGNLYHAEVETPRNDAGYSLLLLGDGEGSFKPIPPSESGLFLPYEVKGLAFLSGSDKEYLLAGCNNGNVQIFKAN